MYTDPSGEFWHIVVGAVVGGVINLTINAIQGNVTNIGNGLGYFFTGAVAGVATIYGGSVAGGAVMGLGNSLTNQATQNGWSNVNVGSVVTGTITGALTSYIGGEISSVTGGFVSNYASNITSSPVLQRALVEGLSNAASGFVVSGGMVYVETGDLRLSLKAGGQGVLFGGGLGLITGGIGGYKYAKDNGLDPWSGDNIELHHSFPKFLGGDDGQKLTPLGKGSHKKLHKELNDFLYQKKDIFGNHMKPQKNNSGINIQRNFNYNQRFEAIKGFYDKNWYKYPRTRYDFYKNNGLKWNIFKI